jgi:hypothetical protein
MDGISLGIRTLSGDDLDSFATSVGWNSYDHAHLPAFGQRQDLYQGIFQGKSASKRIGTGSIGEIVYHHPQGQFMEDPRLLEMISEDTIQTGGRI